MNSKTYAALASALLLAPPAFGQLSGVATNASQTTTVGSMFDSSAQGRLHGNGNLSIERDSDTARTAGRVSERGQVTLGSNGRARASKQAGARAREQVRATAETATRASEHAKVLAHEQAKARLSEAASIRERADSRAGNSTDALAANQ
jgi:hypothetical protein